MPHADSLLSVTAIEASDVCFSLNDIFMMTSDVKYFFTSLLAIYIFFGVYIKYLSLVKVFFIST